MVASERTLILGPGLLGGSLALALAQRGDSDIRVWGRREEPLEELRRRVPQVAGSTSVEDVLPEADLIILATPIGAMPQLMRQIAASADRCPRAVVTDVGSLKVPVVRAAASAFANTSLRFVGSHPMAGSENSGIEAADADLFGGAICIQTPTEGTDAAALEMVRRFWAGLGCHNRTLDPAEHDRVIGHVSHYPHLLAAIGVLGALKKQPTWAGFAGNGLRDTTRVASGSPHLWAEILLENHEAVIEALEVSLAHHEKLLQLLRDGQKDGIYRFLLEAKQVRDRHIGRTDPAGAEHDDDGEL